MSSQGQSEPYRPPAALPRTYSNGPASSSTSLKYVKTLTMWFSHPSRCQRCEALRAASASGTVYQLSTSWSRIGSPRYALTMPRNSGDAPMLTHGLSRPNVGRSSPFFTR